MIRDHNRRTAISIPSPFVSAFSARTRSPAMTRKAGMNAMEPPMRVPKSNPPSEISAEETLSGLISMLAKLSCRLIAAIPVSTIWIPTEQNSSFHFFL